MFGQYTNPAASAKNLGVVKTHIPNIQVTHHIHDLNGIWKSLLTNRFTRSAQIIKISKLHKFKKIFVSRIKTKTGSRAFSIVGPIFWNALPVPTCLSSSVTKDLGAILVILILIEQNSL